MRPLSCKPNLASEWRSSGDDMKKPWMGSMTYVPFRALIEAPLMRRYHAKLNYLVGGVTNPKNNSSSCA